jgi:hypothetical protein
MALNTVDIIVLAGIAVLMVVAVRIVISFFK